MSDDLKARLRRATELGGDELLTEALERIEALEHDQEDAQADAMRRHKEKCDALERIEELERERNNLLAMFKWTDDQLRSETWNEAIEAAAKECERYPAAYTGSVMAHNVRALKRP